MHYPIMLELKDKRCLVVGGGKVALRKTAELVKCGADIVIVSPSLCEDLKIRCEECHIQYIKDVYKKDYLKGVFLCFACTDDREQNANISSDARERGILVNTVDSPGESSFIVPAVRRKGDITLAVSANENPGASRCAADLLSKGLEDWFINYAAMVKGLREKAKLEVEDSKTRQEFIKTLFTEEYLELAKKSITEVKHRSDAMFEKIIQKAGNKNE